MFLNERTQGLVLMPKSSWDVRLIRSKFSKDLKLGFKGLSRFQLLFKSTLSRMSREQNLSHRSQNHSKTVQLKWCLHSYWFKADGLKVALQNTVLRQPFQKSQQLELTVVWKEIFPEPFWSAVAILIRSPQSLMSFLNISRYCGSKDTWRGIENWVVKWQSTLGFWCPPGGEKAACDGL